MMLKTNVVFPCPIRATNPVIFPGGISNEMSSKILRLLGEYENVRFFAASVGSTDGTFQRIHRPKRFVTGNRASQKSPDADAS